MEHVYYPMAIVKSPDITEDCIVPVTGVFINRTHRHQFYDSVVKRVFITSTSSAELSLDYVIWNIKGSLIKRIIRHALYLLRNKTLSYPFATWGMFKRYIQRRWWKLWHM